MNYKDLHLCKLANEYIRKSGSCEEDIYSFFSDEPGADSLFIKLVEEFERCILSYFAYHWSHADLMISQILSADVEPKKKLKHIVMAATREQRFERVTKNLKVARVFNTLVEEMKAMGIASADDSECTEVMAPVAHKDRSPVLLLMGGGMGAGKSTVLKDILKEPFWAGADAVVIEADAFKESDVIYRALSSRGHVDMIKTAEFEELKSTTIKMAEESKVLNTPGAEKQTKRELFDALRQELEGPVLEKASKSVWDLILEKDGLGKEINETIVTQRQNQRKEV